MMLQEYCLDPGELRRLQLVLLEMLKELDRICKKHNIAYCLIAGTMLGAVRHKGFIPWDDDLDVAMSRAEYERFRAACEAELDPGRFFFQDNTTDPHYRWGYGRIRRVGSEFIRVGQEHMKMRTGIFLDVFPMDAVPDAAPLRGLFAMCCFFLRKALYAETGAISAGRCSAGHGGAAHKLKLGAGAVRRMVYCLMRAIPAEWIFRRLDDLAHMAAGRPTRYVRILTFPTPSGRPFGYRREWYEDTADIEFEGMLFPGPRDWDGYLSYKFGDYMTLPPPGQRHWHPVSKFRLPAGV